LTSGERGRDREPGEVVLRVDTAVQLRVGVDLVVHRGGDADAAVRDLVHQHRAGASGEVQCRAEGSVEHGRDPRVVRASLTVYLIGDQLGLQHHACVVIEGLDLVVDRRDRPLAQRHDATGAEAEPLRGGGLPDDLTIEDSAAEIQVSFVVFEASVAHVEGFVVDEESDDLAVREVDDGLARLGVPVAGFGVGQRVVLEHGVQQRPGDADRFTLLEVAP